MEYTKVRDLIQDGDLIGLKERGGFVHEITRFFTKSDYTHTGIAIWLQDGLWMAEINGGRNHLIPMSQIADIRFDVYDCPVDRAIVREKILDSVRLRVFYSIKAFVVAGICDYFGWKKPKWTEDTQICSSYTAKIYYECGWKFGTSLMSPRDICTLLDVKVSVN